ncbi:MAG TPA: ATP-grasp domain-containing protein, partial [Spirochaetia bacterium]|nr:ATP-grasp domain-containing protein [Spirochaetia bacterium]
QAIRYSRTGRVVVEQFIPGREYSIDAIVSDGEITICGIAERHIYFPPAFIEMGHTLPAELSASVERDVVDVFCRGVRALGISNGAAKGDIFHTGHGAVIGEIAARLSGGYMSGWTYPYATGHEVTAAALNIAVGLPPGDLSPKRNWVSAERAFLSIPGTIRRIDGVASARVVPGVKELFLRVETGDSVRFPKNNVEKCGNVIACASDRVHASAAAEAALRCIELRLEPNRPETDEFLFSQRIGLPDPHLFELTADPDIAAVLEYEKSCATIRELSATIHESINAARFPAVVSLPSWPEETVLNWMGMSLAEAVQTVVRVHSLQLIEGDPRDSDLSTQQIHESSAFSGAFWLAIVRGGLQGVRYLLDSILAEAGL